MIFAKATDCISDPRSEEQPKEPLNALNKRKSANQIEFLSAVFSFSVFFCFCTFAFKLSKREVNEN